MHTTLLLVSALSLGSLATGANDDWPHLRGPALDGAAAGTELPADAIGLRPVWTAPLGPSYSGVAIAEGAVVTLMSDGETDAVVALEASDGKERWRHTIGPIYRGHDGSEDGPVASPVIGRGTAFALGPRGRLLALALEDGAVRWSKHLVDDLGAVAPEYGFTSTPLLEGQLLIVQVGGSEERAVCAFDADTGEQRWSLGTGEAAHQSPVALELAGRRQVVVLNGDEILGVAPQSGELLWRHALGERDSAESGIPTPLGDDGFCAYVSGRLAAFRVQATDDGFALEELYRSRELGSSYATPVLHGEHLYGFKSDFLTCVEASTGKRVWKSRPPGGRGLILVGDRLVVFGAEGVVAIARATPDGYEEQTRFQALEFSSFTWPAFADGRVFVRNSQEIACVAVVDRADVSVAEAEAAIEIGGDFGRFLASVAAATDKQPAVDAFLEQHDELPIVEGETVHFVYRGDVTDVAVGGNMTGGGKPVAMERVEGTNLHHASFRIEPGARWEYRFQVDYESWITDPANPRTVPALWGAPMSEVVTAGYEVPTHFAEPSGARGRVESLDYRSEMLGNERKVSIYLPPGYDDGDAAYPLLIVHRGLDWIERGKLTNTLDNTIGETVRPVVVAFVPPIREWWYEGGGTGTDTYLDMLATELVPFLSERYRLSSAPRDRALMGTHSFGMTSIFGVLRHPETFGKAAVQSIGLNDVSRHAIFELIEEKAAPNAVFYVDWSRYEEVDADEGVDQRADGRRIWGALQKSGYTVSGGEALDGSGWGSWRARSDVLLRALFPLR